MKPDSAFSAPLIEILWTSHDSVAAVAELPVNGPLPCRTVLVPRGSIAHALRRDLICAGRSDVLAGTRFILIPEAAVELLRSAEFVFKPGEEALRTARLSALFRSGLPLAHFSLDLLRSMPGWDNAFACSISDLEGAGLRPEDLERTTASARLRDVAAVWRALDESAGHSWTTQRVYLEAARALRRHPECWPFHGPVLAIAAGNLTAAEAGFLRSIPRATIGLLAARPAREHYLKRMEELLGVEAGTALRSAEAPRANASERDLLASYLFEPPTVLVNIERPKSQGPDGSVDIEEHAGVEAELEATADWVCRQVVEEIPLGEIAVLVPDLDPLAGLVAGRLGRLPWHDSFFPVYVAGGLPLTGFAAGARALAVVRALRAHLAAGALADLFPALRLADDTDRRLSRGAVLDLVWSLGTVGGNSASPEGALEWPARAAQRQEQLEQQLSRLRAVEKADDASAIRGARDLERLISDLRALRPALDALVSIARGALENASLPSLWPMLRDFLEERLLQPGDGPRVHIALDEALADVAADATCGLLSGDDALKIVEEAILTARVTTGRFGEPSIYVGAVREAVGLRFSAVRVIGLAEGHLPSVSRGDPVIPDVLREVLPRKGAGLVLSTSDRALESLHALDAVVRDAERRVALSAPRIDVRRSQREPSSVILEAAAALARPNRVTGERTAPIPDRVALERDLFAPAREEAARFRLELPLGEAAWHDGVARGAFGPPARWQGVPALDLDRTAWLRSDSPTAMDGLLGVVAADLPVPGLSPARPISPSGIEALLACPHAFLLGQLLGFEEPASPPPQREIGQPHYGRLFHSVAAEFYTSNGLSFCARERTLAEWIGVADVIVERAFDDFVKEYPLIGDAVRRQQRARLQHDVRELLGYDWDSKRATRFIAAERMFGEPVPIELRKGGRSLYIRGRIDRIDVCGDASLVRDLKTGRAHPRIGKHTDPDPALDLQIAVYGFIAELLSEDWRIPKRIAAAYAYFGRGGGAERSFREDFKDALEPAAKKWLDLAAHLLAERQFPRTPNSEDCTYCCFRPVCGAGVYERSSALLAGAEGVIGDFGRFKAVKSQEQED